MPNIANLFALGQSAKTEGLCQYVWSRHIEMLRLWNLFVKMETHRITKKVFCWDKPLICLTGVPSFLNYWEIYNNKKYLIC